MPAAALSKPTLDGVHLRDGTSADFDFVRNSMRADMERFWPYRSKFDGKLVFNRLLRLIPQLLARGKLTVAEVDGAIASWAILEPKAGVLHWVHTAVPFRRLGLAKVLLSTLPVNWTASHDTQHGSALIKKLGGHFDPYFWMDWHKGASDGEA